MDGMGRFCLNETTIEVLKQLKYCCFIDSSFFRSSTPPHHHVPPPRRSFAGDAARGNGGDPAGDVGA